jgi:glucose 1-dehydrogenase
VTETHRSQSLSGNADLDGRVAIITGAAGGIGAACALRLAELGARVMLADRNADGYAAVLDRLPSNGARAQGTAVDVSDAEACSRLVAETVATFGRLDICVAAAGIAHGLYDPSHRRGSSEPVPRDQSLLINKPIEHWERVIGVNLTGTMLTCRAAAHHLVKQGDGGAIVTVASGAGIQPVVGAGEYCVSKAGVIMLTRVLAIELARYSIRVNAVAPGYTETAMTESLRGNVERTTAILEHIPLRRFAVPRDVADAVAYLSSTAAAYVTGQVLAVDGGHLLGSGY